MSLRVVKIGGSLLTMPDVAALLRNWITHQPKMLNFLLVGGGGLVDAVRELDAIHQLPSAFAHWYCVSLLDQTGLLLKELLPELTLIAEAHELQSARSGAADCIVLPKSFYSSSNPESELAESWDTTSDSIAALLAWRLHAEEIVLLKSAGPTHQSLSPDSAPQALTELASAGLVDPEFPKLASRLARIRLVNLRNVASA